MKAGMFIGFALLSVAPSILQGGSFGGQGRDLNGNGIADVTVVAIRADGRAIFRQRFPNGKFSIAFNDRVLFTNDQSISLLLSSPGRDDARLDNLLGTATVNNLDVILPVKFQARMPKYWQPPSGYGCGYGSYYSDCGYGYGSYYSGYGSYCGSYPYYSVAPYSRGVISGSGSDAYGTPSGRGSSTKPPKENPEVLPEARLKKSLGSGAATFSVSVPKDAKLYFGGKATTTEGADRRFISRGLMRGSEYVHQIRAEVIRGGKTIQQTKSIRTRAGQHADVAFDFETTAGPTTKLTLNVPPAAKVTLAGSGSN